MAMVNLNMWQLTSTLIIPTLLKCRSKIMGDIRATERLQQGK